MATAMTIGGGLVSATGAIHEANSQAALEEYQAQQSQYAASQERASAVEDERRARVVAAKTLGSARANYGASGVSMEGSPLDVLEEGARNAELDALTIRHKGEAKAWAYNAEAEMHRFSAKQARISGYITAASKLLAAGGAASSYSSGAAPSSAAAPRRTG